MLTFKLGRHNVLFQRRKRFRDSLPMANAIFAVICRWEPPERDGFVRLGGLKGRKSKNPIQESPRHEISMRFAKSTHSRKLHDAIMTSMAITFLTLWLYGYLKLPSLKLTYHLKMDGWNTSFLLEWPIFRGKLLVSGRVLVIFFHDFSLQDLVWDFVKLT